MNDVKNGLRHSLFCYWNNFLSIYLLIEFLAMSKGRELAGSIRSIVKLVEYIKSTKHGFSFYPFYPFSPFSLKERKKIQRFRDLVVSDKQVGRRVVIHCSIGYGCVVI